jgi:hypothetical protein
VKVEKGSLLISKCRAFVEARCVDEVHPSKGNLPNWRLR